MKTIYKYPLSEQVNLPISAKILHYGTDPNGNICLWALVDTEEQRRITKEYIIRGTGWPLDEIFQEEGYHYNFITTITNSFYVWHIFEKLHINTVSSNLDFGGLI